MDDVSNRIVRMLERMPPEVRERLADSLGDLDEDRDPGMFSTWIYLGPAPESTTHPRCVHCGRDPRR